MFKCFQESEASEPVAREFISRRKPDNLHKEIKCPDITLLFSNKCWNQGKACEVSKV